jgi:hypothetical protein
MTTSSLRFNPPPGWPKPPDGWVPPKGWTPDPSWPPEPPGWQLWISVTPDSPAVQETCASSTQLGGEPTTNSESSRLVLLEAEISRLRAELSALQTGPCQAVNLDDERVLQDVGVYRYHHPLENATAYRDRLTSISARIAEMVKEGSAIESSTMFTFDGSLAKGRSMTNDLSKLMLRAYNAEAENVVRTLRSGNIAAALGRLHVARAAIAKLGSMMELHISEAYHALRIEEIELTADYMVRKEEEREAARAERERLREERKVEMELAAAREKLDKERAHLVVVIDKLRASGGCDTELERKLSEVDAAIAQNDFRAANIRAGYVYVISNRGAFGRHVVKIGLTRRLEPLDRIRELGDASVPFMFDVHAIYFSEDAVRLEGELHQHFASRRVNFVNMRREFFFATPAEVREVLAEKLGNLLEFIDGAESAEYLQSLRYWPEHVRTPETTG